MTTRSNDRARTRREREREAAARREATRRRRAGRGRPALSLTAISALALIGGVLVIAAAIALGPRPASVSPVAPIGSTGAGTFAGLPTDGFALGRADAPVTIDLYEDFQCPACRRWGETVFPSLAANELASGRARLVFHDFAFIGPESLSAARAGQAAARQDRFWDMWAAIYANQGAENSGALTPSRLTEIARGLGLNVEQFTADLQLSATGPAVDASNAAAHRLGVNSTPTIVIGERILVGASHADIAAAIADAAGD